MLFSHREIQERGTGRKKCKKKESIHDTVLYYFMTDSIERISFRLIEV